MSEDKRLREEVKKRNEDLYRESSKKRLMKNVERKFKTTMIGALASFEECFGHLWGHGKDDDEISTDEMAFRQLWEQARTDVLNNGNSQLRIAQEEIAQYTMTWNRYHIDFIVKPQDNKENDDE